MSTTSSQLDMHPDHGLLPPNPPPPSAPDNSLPGPGDAVDGNSHPQYGLRPPPPPSTPSGGSCIAPQQEVTSQMTAPYSAPPNGQHGGYTETSNSQCSDELGPQSMGHSETTMTSNATSYSTSDYERPSGPPSHTLSDNSTTSRSSYHSLGNADDQEAELERLRKIVEQLKFKNRQLEQTVGGLRHENMELKKQLNQQRPSNLQFTQPYRPPPYHYSPGHGAGGDYNSLTPSRGVVLRPRNPSPSPGGEWGDVPVLRPANSSGSLNSHSSKGSYTPSESQV